MNEAALGLRWGILHKWFHSCGQYVGAARRATALDGVRCRKCGDVVVASDLSENEDGA